MPIFPFPSTPMFPTRGENLPVHLPPVWPDLSTLGLYLDPQTDSSSQTRVGVSSCNLHRRYPADGGVEGDGTRTGLSPSISSPVPGVHHKLREDRIATNSNTTRVSVLLRLDNTSAVAYINNQGGTIPKKLVSLTRDLWMWCLKRSIHIQAQHLPGIQTGNPGQ